MANQILHTVHPRNYFSDSNAAKYVTVKCAKLLGGVFSSKHELKSMRSLMLSHISLRLKSITVKNVQLNRNRGVYQLGGW